jgi:hypothetical protein
MAGLSRMPTKAYPCYFVGSEIEKKKSRRRRSLAAIISAMRQGSE